jgi:hypothetical protein
MTTKEKAVILLVAFAIRCLYPSSRRKWDRAADRGEYAEGEAYDVAFRELINALKSDSKP